MMLRTLALSPRAPAEQSTFVQKVAPLQMNLSAHLAKRGKEKALGSFGAGPPASMAGSTRRSRAGCGQIGGLRCRPTVARTSANTPRWHCTDVVGLAPSMAHTSEARHAAPATCGAHRCAAQAPHRALLPRPPRENVACPWRGHLLHAAVVWLCRGACQCNAGGTSTWLVPLSPDSCAQASTALHGPNMTLTLQPASASGHGCRGCLPLPAQPDGC